MNSIFQPITLTHPSGSTATLCRYGAHLTSWKLAGGEEQLFLSSKALFQEEKSIRGGVPIIFPQFNEFGDGPRHGFARTSVWRLITPPAQQNDVVTCELELTHSSETEKIWPYRFHAIYSIELGKNSLSLRLKIKNTGDTSFSFTAALHSYFKISALENISLKGLHEQVFWDNDGSHFSNRKSDEAVILNIPDALDRVYFDVENPLVLVDTKKTEKSLTITQSGFSDVVVWNPGRIATEIMQDMSNSEYQNMLCVEAAQIDNSVYLGCGEEWTGIQLLESNSSN